MKLSHFCILSLLIVSSFSCEHEHSTKDSNDDALWAVAILHEDGGSGVNGNVKIR
jgi:hypothetical protein